MSGFRLESSKPAEESRVPETCLDWLARRDKLSLILVFAVFGIKNVVEAGGRPWGFSYPTRAISDQRHG